MTPEYWNELERHFDAAVRLREEARREYLARLEPKLAREVEVLLRNDENEANPLAELIGDMAAGVETEQTQLAGRLIGPYRVEREIGRGGMGVVFLAERADGAFTQRAALKVAFRAGYSTTFRVRFLRERQILARLDHPHIARLLDGGTTAEGLPYFAMEYVEGEPITACATKLSLTAKLELFGKVAEAVQFAHQHLVVHRDIKPGNILVDAAGQPKLLDFGIAKLLSDTGAEQTRTGLAPLTPEYAAPEQLAHQPVTTRTDIFQLGRLLGQLAPVAPPDLAAILAMATHSDPDRRYATVAALQADIANFLAGRPVTARPDSFGYRAGKFLARNRYGVLAATLMTAVLAGAVWYSLLQGRRAERRFAQVRDLANTLLFPIQEAIQPLPGSLPAQDLVTQTGLKYLDALAAESSTDPALAIELAGGYARLATIAYSNKHASKGERHQAEDLHEKALRLLAPLGSQPGALTVRGEIAISQAELLKERGNEAAARQLLIDTHATFASLPSTAPFAARLKRAELLQVLTRDFATPQDDFGARLLAEVRQLANEEPGSLELQANLAIALSAAAGMEVRAQRFAEGIALLERSLALQENLTRQRPADLHFQRNLMLAHAKLGDALKASGPQRAAEALEHYRIMAAMAEALRKAEPGASSRQLDYAVSLARYGDALPPGDAQAVARLNEAARILTTLLKDDSGNQRYAAQLADVQRRLAARR
jgi:serine/threonine protein kinase